MRRIILYHEDGRPIDPRTSEQVAVAARLLLWRVPSLKWRTLEEPPGRYPRWHRRTRLSAAYSQISDDERTSWDLDFLAALLFFFYVDAVQAGVRGLRAQPGADPALRAALEGFDLRTGPERFCAWLADSRMGSRLRVAMEADYANAVTLRQLNPAARRHLDRFGWLLTPGRTERAVRALWTATRQALCDTGPAYGLPIPPALGGPSAPAARLANRPPRRPGGRPETTITMT